MSFTNKQILRQEIKERVEQLDEAYCHSASKRICDKVIALKEYKEAKTFFSFVGTRGEVDTKPLIQDAIARGKTVGVPLCISDSVMEIRQIRDIDQDLQPGMLGILEPLKHTRVLEAAAIDFAVIPCVTCDHQGNRLGHGKGYYDRYLADTNFPTCLICFERLVSKEIPIEEFDQKISRVITDAK